MSGLPKIGESLDKTQTIETVARQKMKGGDYDHVCTACRTTPYPRGFSVNDELCWFCRFPR